MEKIGRVRKETTLAIVSREMAKPRITASVLEARLDLAAGESRDLEQTGIKPDRRKRTMTRILLVDDHDMARKRIRQMIQKRKKWKVCGEAADGRDAIHKHDALKPHVVVMDLKMPRLDGLQAARRILKQRPSARIVMLSASASRQIMEEVRKVGIRGFCPKSRMDILLEALEAVLRGETYFPKHSNSERTASI